LLGADYGFTCHTLLNTPKELWKFSDNESMHNYDHIPASDRTIISNVVKRDTKWEEALVERHKLATQLFLNYIDDFMSPSRHVPSLEIADVGFIKKIPKTILAPSFLFARGHTF